MWVRSIVHSHTKAKLYTLFSQNVQNLNQFALFRITSWLVSKVMFWESGSLGRKLESLCIPAWLEFLCLGSALAPVSCELGL